MIDLRSDTVTKPTAGMRAAMAAAEVGDDVFGEDPTVNALERRVAAMFGKEAGLFVPSGTQANQIAIRCLTEPGDEVILEASAHPFLYEAGGPAVISGVTLRPVPGTAGVLDPDVVRAAVRPPNVHHSPARMLSIENTANRGGGTVVSIERVRALCEVARGAGLATHLDGARIWNAHVATGVPLSAWGAPFDVVNVCFSKGLGAPVGSMVLLPARLLEKARRVRKMLGGGMRQAGILAAAADYALDHHLARLADDHARARRLWEGLRGLGFDADRPDTNMVYVRVPDAPAVAQRLATHVRCIALSHDQIRLVTHLEIDDAAIEGAIAAFASIGG
jgi:threonine aldolase